MRAQSVVSLFALALAAAGAIRGEDEEYPPESIGAAVTERDGVRVHEAILPGGIVDWTRLSGPAGRDVVLILSEMEVTGEEDTADERLVWLWEPSGKGALSRLGPPLGEEATHVMATPGRSAGEQGVLVAAGSSILGLDSAGHWIEIFEFDYDLFPVQDSRGGRWVAETLLLRSFGGLLALEYDAAAGQWRKSWLIELPLSVDRTWGALRLETPPVAVLGGFDQTGPQLVVGPDVQGMRRILSTLIPLESPTEPEPLETWSMLSNLEQVEESWYVRYDGSPALIVTTLLADKHGVFEKKKLRLFALTADRTRAGSGPLLETLTRSRNWYGTCAGIADVNRDGIDDLVSAQPKGLGAGSLWVEAHLGLPDGGFDSRPRGSEVDVEEGEVCSLAIDVVGDRTVDLVVIEGNSLLVFPLISAREAKTVVEQDPEHRVTFEDLSGRPRPFDSPGREASRLVVKGRTPGKRHALRLVEFP